MQLRRLTSVAGMFLAFAFAWLWSMSVQTAQAQDGEDEQPAAACGSDAYLASLPVPAPQGSGIKRQVQLVNCSDQVLLGAATAAHDAGKPPYPVFPQAVPPAKAGSWVMQAFNPNNPTNYANVLTVDIPPEWYGQFKKGGVGAVFWARTGCRYDPVTNRAQCETGSCADQYDCSSAEISPPNATTIIEWTFYQQFGNYFIDSPDISAVNGANLTVDVSPRGSSEFDPRSQTNWHWLEWNYPLTVHGADLREAANCTTASAGSFKVFRADIDKTKGSKPGYPKLGYVVVDSNGMPTLPAFNFALACLSNCGKYKFPEELGYPKCNPKTDANCYFWDTFCAGDISIKYGGDCSVDADCLKYNNGMDYHIACFHNSGPNGPGRCDLRGFFNGTVSACNGVPDPQPAAPTSTVACTNTYGSINPLAKNEADKYDWNDQPIVGNCTDVVFVGTGKKAACIGEDTLHKILHGAYTWPNDPQVYSGDAPVYRIVFSPEGRGKANITPAQPSIPLCSATTTFPSNYKYAENRGNCGISVNNQGAVFGIGVVRNQPPNQWYSSGSDWPCNPDQRSDASQGVLCRWDPPPADHCSLGDNGNCNCTPPTTDDQYVTNSACGRIDSDTSLVSGSITPNNNDSLFVEVSISKVMNPANAPVSVTGCAPAWSLVASKALPTNLGIVAWYKGTSNTNVACTVTVTLANKNPAELKVYDVPKFNGTIETTSNATGAYNGGGSFAPVNAGTASTAFSSDLQLGALLMVDQVPAPITYWTNWLTNGPNQLQCLMRDLNCPVDDGPDYLPGHGPFSSNSDVGHNNVTPGTQYFHRDGFNLGQYSWVGLAIYPELNQ
ncbi:MAG: thaumatin family protein [Candidatus Korobacteraceae bacterium]